MALGLNSFFLEYCLSYDFRMVLIMFLVMVPPMPYVYGALVTTSVVIYSYLIDA